jgi:hypothetical protein
MRGRKNSSAAMSADSHRNVRPDWVFFVCKNLETNY